MMFSCREKSNLLITLKMENTNEIFEKMCSILVYLRRLSLWLNRLVKMLKPKKSKMK